MSNSKKISMLLWVVTMTVISGVSTYFITYHLTLIMGAPKVVAHYFADIVGGITALGVLGSTICHIFERKDRGGIRYEN